MRKSNFLMKPLSLFVICKKVSSSNIQKTSSFSAKNGRSYYYRSITGFSLGTIKTRLNWSFCPLCETGIKIF